MRTPTLRLCRRFSEAESVGVRGFAGALATAKGVSGWRPKTPTGLSGDGRCEVTIEGYCGIPGQAKQ